MGEGEGSFATFREFTVFRSSLPSEFTSDHNFFTLLWWVPTSGLQKCSNLHNLPRSLTSVIWLSLNSYSLEFKNLNCLKFEDTGKITEIKWPLFDRYGVFHLPKDSGKFRKLWWEMSIGKGRVPFDTLVPFIPRLPSPSDVFPTKTQNGGTTVVVEQNARLLFGRREPC